MRDRIHPRTIIGEIKRYGPEWLEKFPQLPQMVYSALEQSREVAPQLQGIGEQLALSHRRGRRQYLRRAAGVILAAGTAVLAAPGWWAQMPPAGWIMGVAALVLLLWP